MNSYVKQHLNKKKENNELPKPVMVALKEFDRNQPTPLYQQLLQLLYEVLKDNKLEPGSFFATEALLQKVTGMSRSTIRKAIEELTRMGLLVRVTGKGTYVTLPDVQVVVPELKSLTQELIERGMKPGAVFLKSDWVSIPEQIENDLKKQNRILNVERIRTGNGVPILFSSAYFPEYIKIDADQDFSGSLYEILKEHGKVPYTATHTIGATIIDQEIAKSLKIKSNTAGLYIRRKTYEKDGSLILYEEGIGRGDIYNYTLSMQHYPQI